MTRPSKTKILVVDDDLHILEEVKSYLEKLGDEVVTAKDGYAALRIARSISPALVVLDVTLEMGDTFRKVSPRPQRESLDGIEVLRRLRDSGNVPVLMLSATNVAVVKVMALTIGADDYLSKPFDLQELSARIDAILRRTRNGLPKDQVLNLRRLRLDPGARRVWKDGEPIALTGIEFDMLYTLARRPDHVFTRDKLLESAWKATCCCVPKAVDVHIGHIRRKVEDNPDHPTLIVTVRGAGYRFEDVPA